MQTVLNVRMDSTLKKRGDKVLSDNGISVSDAVRSLWTQLAETRTIPEFMEQADENEKRKKLKLDALNRLCSIGNDIQPSRSSFINSGDKAIRDEIYDDMIEKYEALK